MLSTLEKVTRLRAIYDLGRQSEDIEEGFSLEEGMAALVVSNWAILAFDDEDNLALSFHLDAHPNAVAKLTRFLVTHDVPFVLYEAFTVNDRDEIVFESDVAAPEE